MEANAVVPLWPSLGADGNVSRRMCFLFGEARWYLWMQDANKQAIAALRRDLLLLHQNGDLELVKEPSSGSYVTALHDGKMVRGRVLAPKDKLDSSNNIRNTVSLIDLDEGQTYVVATNQIRLLPPELTSLPCQAVRCDIGLDCIEQFTWPPELNSMLQRALEKAYLFVTNTSSRPGSIPTILAEIVIFNPSTGQSMTIQNWLLNFFSPHLDLCSLDKYIPFPVGMTPELMEKALEFQQQQVLGFQVQGSGAFSPMTPNGPQGIHGGSPGNALSEGIPSPSTVFTGPNSLSTKKTPSMSSSMPTHMPMPPLSGLNSSPCIMPNRMPIGMQPATYGGLHGMPSNIPPSLPNIMPTGVPSGANSMPVGMRPSVPNCMAPNVNPSMQNCVPTGMHSSMAESFPFVQQRNIHNVGPGGYSRNVTPSYHHGPQPHFNSPQHFCGVPLTNTMPHHGFMQTRSPSPVPSFSVSFPSQMLSSTPTLPSLTKQKLSGASSCSPQASSSSSSSVSSVGAPDPLPVKSGLLTKTNENEGPMIPSNITNLSNSEFLKQCQPQSSGTTLQLIREKECDSPPDSSGSLEQENNGTQTTTATSGTVSNLNINAPPFDGSLRKVRGNGPTSSSGLSADAPLFVPLECSTGTAAKEDMNIQTESNSKKVSPIDDEGTVSTSNFKTGKEVTLLQIVRDWKRGQVLQAFMARVWNPSCFEVNVVDQYSGLLSRIQGEMTDYYVSHSKKILSKTEGKELCGNYCACFDADENFWFRAEVDNWFMDDSVTPLKVWAVDYGGFSRVDISHIQPLVTELACTSPILVTICSMMNIQPCSNNGIWPEIHLNRVKELLPEDNSLYIRVDGSMSIDHIWPVSVFTDSECLQSINEILVAEGCASYIGSKLIDSLSGEQYEDADNPMEEAYKIGGNNYDIDDEDACVAVSGRKPTEEIGICWFYNSHGYCYKKFCSKKHVRLDPDGHSIEKVGMFTRSYEELDESFLTSGKTIKLTVTRILTVNHFIARVHAGKGTPGIKSRETLSSVIKHLNSKDMRRSLKTFTEFPADGEVVLFKDKSGTFFRGRVLCADSNDENLYEVLNVDSGYLQMVPLHDLRRVDPAFLHHPFQAVECWLADVAPIENDPECVKTSNEIFADLVRGQRMVATVIRSSPWGIEVNMCDKDHRDIAIALLEMNLVTKSPMRHLPVSDSHQIPG